MRRLAVAMRLGAVGQPFRLRPLREAIKHIMGHHKDIWLALPGEIATYWMRLPKGTIRGG